MTLKVGVHPNNLHLQLAFLAAAQDGPHAGIAFVPYAEGRDTGRLLADAVIDVGGTGSTPPVLAQGDGVDLVYLAASSKRPSNGSLVVRTGDAADSVAALAGKRVALLDGSFHTYFLAVALERAGLRLGDVTRVELGPAASAQALRDGTVDAWVAMEPHLNSALAQGEVRALAHVGDFAANRSVFWARRDVLRHKPLLLRHFLDHLAGVGADIMARPGHYARLLHDAGIADAGRDAWEQVLRQRDWRIHPADDGVLAEQQAEADALLRHGVIARAIDVRGATASA